MRLQTARICKWLLTWLACRVCLRLSWPAIVMRHRNARTSAYMRYFGENRKWLGVVATGLPLSLLASWLGATHLVRQHESASHFQLELATPDTPLFADRTGTCTVCGHAWIPCWVWVARYTQAPSHTSSQLPTDLDDVDFEEYPLYAKATPIYVDLQPGETLFMPAGWWHTARVSTRRGHWTHMQGTLCWSC